ncbi:MAG: hypothetical protein IPK53_09005 [bacterium]|nr:hypothetical protein [bacterium]
MNYLAFAPGLRCGILLIMDDVMDRIACRSRLNENSAIVLQDHATWPNGVSVRRIVLNGSSMPRPR